MIDKKSEDLRVKKTKAALKKGLETLLAEETFDKITVSKICDEAMVNRVTFYGHYQDKYELFYDFLNDIKDYLKKKTMDSIPLQKKVTKNIECIFTALCDNFIDVCVENKALLAAFTFQENTVLTFMIQELATEELYKLYDELEKEIPLEYDKTFVCPFLVGGASRMVFEWLSHGGTKETAEKFKTSATQMIKEAFYALRKNNKEVK